ncbi:MAG: hypothetical protein FJY97_16795 [candidate division Zixibacteria bacterium]|nr:hypothetical protein [candidate division Zixibacteria bacterium]
MGHHPEHTWGHTAPFGIEYYRVATGLLRQIGDDATLIAEVAAKTVETIRAGRTVYMNVSTGHMPSLDLIADREGSPGIFHVNTNDSNTPEEYAAMRSGDMLLTNRVSEAVKEVRDRGVYVVVFTTCYVNNRITPPGMVQPNENDLMPEDVASRVVDSHIPWQQGILNVPEIPTMPVCPGSSNVTCSIHWMITAEAAYALATGGAPDGSKARLYVNTVLARLAAIRETQWTRIAEIAPVIARRIISGGHYFVRSRNGGVESEASGVAAGLYMVNKFELRPAQEGGEKDVTLIAAVSPNDPKELEWADEARAHGHLVVGIGQPQNNELRSRCDLYLDDLCPELGGVVPVPGRPEGVSPATGIVNNVAMYMVAGQFIDEMCRRGAVPCFYMGYYRTLGKPYNEVMGFLFDRRGY